MRTMGRGGVEYSGGRGERLEEGFFGQTEQNVLWAEGWGKEKGWRKVRKSQVGLCCLVVSSERQREALQTLQINSFHTAGASDPDSWRPPSRFRETEKRFWEGQSDQLRCREIPQTC